MTPMEKTPRFLQDDRPNWMGRFQKWLLAIVAVGFVWNIAGIGCPYEAIMGSNNDKINYRDAIDKALKINLAEELSFRYTNESHLAGENYGLVEFTQNKFEEFGFKLEVDEYEVLLSKPQEHGLWLRNGPKVVYEAPLKEDAISEDPTTLNATVPTFVGYGANGNVTAPYIYGGYCRVDDFADLVKQQVPVNGLIVVCRYGKIFRGLKVKFAQDNGAAGVLLYTDPGDDGKLTPDNGYKQYPEGPARHELSVQRGSVQFLGGIGATPGDPTTPGKASKPGVKREDPHSLIGKIPVLPISYREVTPILEALNGHGSAFGSGGLKSYNYTTGPHPSLTLNLYSKQKFGIEKIYNVYGVLEGTSKNEVIVIGNHRDAWINGGAGDPNLGSAVLLEIARALGEVAALGYKFRRTIALHLYDGEEYGLLGSTEQGEYNANDIQKKVVAYINLDTAVSGLNLHVSASPLLNDVLLKVAAHIEHPNGGTLLEDFEKKNGNIHHLGSGSDYTVYQEHLGVPLADIGFSGGDSIYHYHSNYDLFHWMKKFGDPGFVYHNLAAQYIAQLVGQLSEHEVLEFGLATYFEKLTEYFDDVKEDVRSNWLGRKVKAGCAGKPKPKPSFVKLIMGCGGKSKQDKQHAKQGKHGKHHVDDENKKVSKMAMYGNKHGNQHGEFENEIQQGEHDMHGEHRMHGQEKVYGGGMHGVQDRHHGNTGMHDVHGSEDELRGSGGGHGKEQGDNERRANGPDGDEEHHRRHGPHPDDKHRPHALSKNHKKKVLKDVLAEVSKQLKKATEEAKKFDARSKELTKQLENWDNLGWWQKIKLHFKVNHHNKVLKSFEQLFLVDEGLHLRPWFKHQVFAAGRFTGYAGQTLPGLVEAIEDNDYERFVKWLRILSRTVAKTTDNVNDA